MQQAVRCLYKEPPRHTRRGFGQLFRHEMASCHGLTGHACVALRLPQHDFGQRCGMVLFVCMMRLLSKNSWNRIAKEIVHRPDALVGTNLPMYSKPHRQWRYF